MPAQTIAGLDDWTFIYGSWRVHHRRLVARLAGSDEWQEFEGTSRFWPLMDGAGNVDDNFVDLPGDPYRAVSLRSLDPETGLWSIWWLDGRRPGVLDVPVVGNSWTASAPSSATTPSTAGRSSSASCGRGPRRRHRGGSRRSRPTAGTRGRRTGRWISNERPPSGPAHTGSAAAVYVSARD